MEFDAIIIGAGACGLMCAVQAGYLGKRVLILEKSEKPGKKILISGGGRCNYTNLFAQGDEFITQNPNFLKSAFKQWTVDDTIQFFEMNGITGKEKTLGQLFPENKNAKDIVEVFTSLCADFGHQIQCGVEEIQIQPLDSGYLINYKIGERKKQINSNKLVIATGGLPISKMGATDFALKFASKLGMDIVPTAPALVPLTITGKDAPWYAQLSGNSVFCAVYNERIKFEEQILFTHWGLSGPAILQISSYWRPGETFTIDFLPGMDIEQLLQEQRQLNGKQQLSTFLNNYYTRKFTESIGLNLPLEKQIANLNRVEIEALVKLIHNFKVKPAGDKGYDKAEVMRGGINTNELSSKTLESKKYPGLYFGGECVDVTGWLGGYNFQWAWASGYVIAQQL